MNVAHYNFFNIGKILVNTSFNVRGEPIVNTPSDIMEALKQALITNNIKKQGLKL